MWKTILVEPYCTTSTASIDLTLWSNSMNILPAIAAAKDEMVAIYRDLHANPEVGFEETRTSKIVDEKLVEYGVDEVHTGLGRTGVDALVHGKSKGNRPVGLRARHGYIAD